MSSELETISASLSVEDFWSGSEESSPFFSEVEDTFIIQCSNAVFKSGCVDETV